MHRFVSSIAGMTRDLSAFALAMLLLVVAGCASAPSTDRAVSESSARSVPAGSDASVSGPRERPRGELPTVETSEAGFTITEQVRISGDARAKYQQATMSLEQGRYDEGIAQLLEVIELAPDLTAPYIDLGIAYSMSGDLDAAEEALSSALELAPGHPVALNELGIVYRRTGRFDAARASYEKALVVYPGYHFARRNLGVLCDLYLSDPVCALNNYEAYLDAVVEDGEVEIWAADLRTRLGR